MLALEWNLDDALQARFDDGIEQGRSEEREALIIKMLRKGKSFDEIHEFIDIPIQRIQELAQNISFHSHNYIFSRLLQAKIQYGKILLAYSKNFN